MAEIIPIIIGPILQSCETPLKAKAVDGDQANGPEINLDSDEEEDGEVLDIDIENADEQTTAIHCLGNLSMNCPGLMQPHLEQICKKFQEVGDYDAGNVKFHVYAYEIVLKRNLCLSYLQIAFGQFKLALGREDSDQKYGWTPGFPVQEPLPA